MKLSDVQDIAVTQKLEVESQKSGLKRLILPDLPDIQSHALVVSGIRRCGKSTLLRQFVQKLERSWFYLNFDDIRLASFSHADFGLLDRAIADSGAKLLFLMKFSQRNIGSFMPGKNWMKAFSLPLPVLTLPC